MVTIGFTNIEYADGSIERNILSAIGADVYPVTAGDPTLLGVVSRHDRGVTETPRTRRRARVLSPVRGCPAARGLPDGPVP